MGARRHDGACASLGAMAGVRSGCSGPPSQHAAVAELEGPAHGAVSAGGASWRQQESDQAA
eukprot:6385683-Alexandrium_andersonii.AAC.1